MALGYLGLLMWWNEKTSGVLIDRIRALGKTALTNYIGQTIVCVVLASLLPGEWMSRTTVFLLIIVIWWAQLYLAEKWLKRYRLDRWNTCGDAQHTVAWRPLSTKKPPRTDYERMTHEQP